MLTCEVIKNTFKEDIATECKGRYRYTLKYHEILTWKIKHLLTKSMIFSTELSVLPTTALNIMLGIIPDVYLKEQKVKMVEINTPV